jgi:hypothetical protein
MHTESSNIGTCLHMYICYIWSLVKPSHVLTYTYTHAYAHAHATNTSLQSLCMYFYLLLTTFCYINPHSSVPHVLVIRKLSRVKERVIIRANHIEWYAHLRATKISLSHIITALLGHVNLRWHAYVLRYMHSYAHEYHTLLAKSCLHMRCIHTLC